MSDLQHGCFFCLTGKETDVIEKFKRHFPEGRALTPTRTRYRRAAGTAIEERVPLLPGYVFFELKENTENVRFVDGMGVLSETDYMVRQFVRTEDVIRLLKYSDGGW